MSRGFEDEEAEKFGDCGRRWEVIRADGGMRTDTSTITGKLLIVHQ
jgi:hypothetical protein